MALLVLAYPELSKRDFERIQAFRRRHDALYCDVVEPHFTLVFPVPDWEVEPFVAEIIKQAQGFPPFDFCLRCAVLNKDAFSDVYHAFLVPDEGYSRVVRLHDRLYADRLFPNRALMVDFVPHVGVGNAQDPLQCLEMVRAWNREEFAIAGRVAALDVANYEHDAVETIERVFLRVLARTLSNRGLHRASPSWARVDVSFPSSHNVASTVSPVERCCRSPCISKSFGIQSSNWVRFIYFKPFVSCRRHLEQVDSGIHFNLPTRKERGMKIAIMGSGGLGSYIGGRLAYTGQDVTFIARGAQLAALQQQGLTVKSHYGDFSLDTVTATDNPAQVGPVDLILFCVKSYSAPGAAEQMKPIVGPETAIIPVLNGVDHIEMLQATVGREHVLGGVCIISAHLVEPGRVEQGGPFHGLVFGELNGDLSERCMMFQQVLAESGIEAAAIPDIVARMWWKVTAMCGLFGVYSVVRGNNAVVSAIPETRSLVLQAVGEALAVAQAQQIPVSDAIIDEVDAAIDNMPPTYQPSMKVDLEQGRRIELEAVNGFISRLGKTLGVPTPVNDFLYACLKPYVNGAVPQT